jgi:hypothetical protein
MIQHIPEKNLHSYDDSHCKAKTEKKIFNPVIYGAA